MPRLTDYILGQEAVAAGIPKQPPTQAAKPLSTQQPVHHVVPEPLDGAEAARLQQQHGNRLKQHGPRMYRQSDGSLAPSPPAKQPYTVANRRKWHGVVQHCRQLPGVNQQLERTGRSARYGVNSTHQQHAAALAAAGLVPEFDASGSWTGFEQGADDPLTDASHSLRHDGWRAITSAVLQRAVEVHGAPTLQKNGWRAELY